MSDFEEQVKVARALWCNDEGHDWIRIQAGDERPENAPRVLAGEIWWCRNCFQAEVTRPEGV